MPRLNFQQRFQTRIRRGVPPPPLPPLPVPPPSPTAPEPPPAPPQPSNGALSHEEAKKLLDTSATTNRNLFIAFNLLLATALILCLSVSDEQLLLDNTPIPLPFINVSLPTWAFASVLPLFVLVLHFDLLHNLNEHASKLQTWVAAWEKKFPPAPAGTAASAENVQLSTLLFPFLYDFAWLHAKGRGPDSINLNRLPNLCWIIYCWAPYSVLLIFLIRFLDLQSYFYTGWHLALVGLDVAFMVCYWPRFGAAQSRFRVWRWIRKLINLPVVMLLFSTLVATWSFTLYCLIQRHLDGDGSAEWVNEAIELERKIKPKLGLTLVPRIVMPGYRIKLDANHFTLAEIQTPGKNKAELWPHTAASAKLSERRLGFADFSNAHMPRADFTEANLKGADLSSAQLQGTHLRAAQLQGAFMQGGQLQGADLNSAQLQGANLNSAQLQGADLHFTLLHGAELSSAQLQGTNLFVSQLQGANLRFAQLHGAYLSSARLQGADLSSATIKGSVLAGAQLHSTSLPEANEFTATSGQIDWQTTFNFSELKDGTWFSELHYWNQQDIERRINTAELHAKKFTIPTLPPANTPQFSAAWLEVLCQDTAIAKAMLQHNMFRRLPSEISDAQLRQWMQAKAQCQPYLALAETALANRKAENDAAQKKP